MDRRKFLKFICASAILPVIPYKKALLMGANKIKGAEKFITGCMWCQAGCTMVVFVKNGKVVHLTGNPDDPVTKGALCIKPFGSLEILKSPARLKHPLKRSGKKYVKISWDEILDEIAYNLKQLKEKYGGECLGIWASGRSAFDGRLLNKAFAKLYGTPNWEKTGPFCNYSGKIAGITTTGTRHTPWIYDHRDFYFADLYIFIGSNMAATRAPIFLNLEKEKKIRECKFICIDPRKTETANKSDKWLPIRPGTDLALALGLMHYIIKNNLENKKFIEKHTEGFENFRKELLENNYSIKWASSVTGIPANDLEKLAKLYATTKKAIIIGNAGLSHHTNSVQTHRAFNMLAAITGHFGKPGMGYACLNNGGHKIGEIPVPKSMTPHCRQGLGKNPVTWLESVENPEYPYKLKALISTGSPLTQWPEQNKIRRIIPKLELSVWNGIVPSVNAYYFKYILPAATWIEAGGIAPVSDDSRFAFVPKIVQPPGEAKPDRWWWIELGKKMGWKKIFKDEFKDYKKLIDFACAKYGFSVENFIKEEKTRALRAPVGRKTLFANGKFQTKSGKFLFSANKEKFKICGLSTFPHFYIDPDIAKKGENTIGYEKILIKSPFQKGTCFAKPVKIIKKSDSSSYFLNLITGRPSWAIMGDASHWSKLLYSISPNQICVIHHETAKLLNIKNHSKINVISPYGKATCLAVISEEIRNDTIFVPYSYGEKQPFSPWESINFVTNSKAMCPISGQIAFKGIKVKIEKI